jgi:hypothetical protein
VENTSATLISRTLLDKPAVPHKAKSFPTRSAALKRQRLSTRNAALKEHCWTSQQRLQEHAFVASCWAQKNYGVRRP